MAKKTKTKKIVVNKNSNKNNVVVNIINQTKKRTTKKRVKKVTTQQRVEQPFQQYTYIPNRNITDLTQYTDEVNKRNNVLLLEAKIKRELEADRGRTNLLMAQPLTRDALPYANSVVITEVDEPVIKVENTNPINGRINPLFTQPLTRENISTNTSPVAVMTKNEVNNLNYVLLNAENAISQIREKEENKNSNNNNISNARLSLLLDPINTQFVTGRSDERISRMDEDSMIGETEMNIYYKSRGGANNIKNDDSNLFNEYTFFKDNFTKKYTDDRGIKIPKTPPFKDFKNTMKNLLQRDEEW